MGARALGPGLCRSVVVSLLVLLLLASGVPTRGAEISCPDNQLQAGQDNGAPVALVSHQLILPVSRTATYLSCEIGEVCPKLPVIFSPAYRGPPA